MTSGFRLAAMLLATATVAQDFSTTNTNTLSRFWATAQATNRPVTVVSFGDSMADSYRSVTFSVIDMLVESLGVAGYSLNNYRNTTLVNVANGAQVIIGPTPLWFSDYWQIPHGGSLWYESQNSPNGVYSDKLGVFWVAQPQGGQMTFSVSTDQGAWTPLLTLNGYAPVATGQYTNVVLTPDFHRIRVDGVTGTNSVIGPQLLLQTTSGVHAVFMDKAGIAISDVANVPSAIRTPIFAALSPDLLIWHMKEDDQAVAVTSNGLMTCEQWWSNAAPRCDVIYIGTPYKDLDTNSATAVTVTQNTLVRYTALQYSRAYCDLMNPSASWPWMNSQGYMADGVHVTYDGGLYLARYLWQEFGFQSLGVGIPPQTASFSASPTNGIIPLAVSFTDTSTASITNWFWNFGDGTTTNLMNEVVQHTYASTGTFAVTEIITVPGGTITNTQSNYITVLTPFQAWQVQYFGSTTNPAAAANVDADGTGQNNQFKYVAGLDPTNPTSVFRWQIIGVTNQPSRAELLFIPLALGRTYTPQFSTDLVNGIWSPLTTCTGPKTNNGNQITITDTNAIGPQEFYRIDITYP
jgi:PKD repeat protein